jgi:DNA-binding MarR family transcriptional regulator
MNNISNPETTTGITPERRILENRALVEIRRSSNQWMSSLAGLLKPLGLTESQYNILRILRGARPDGLCVQELAGRMIAQAPDMTRLLDRLESQGRISREHVRHDRRMVQIRITDEGLDVLGQLDQPFEAWRIGLLEAFSQDELRALVQILSKVRQPA